MSKKIGVYSLTASTTSANLSAFDYSALPAAINGKMIYWWHSLPAVSAATCCADVVLHDVDSNVIWHSAKGETSGSTQAENTSTMSAAGVRGQTAPIPVVAGDHFHILWSARPSAESTGLGTDVTSTLKVWIEE
jgi:hypothetical protein